MNGTTERGEKIHITLGLTEKVLAAIITLAVVGWASWVSTNVNGLHDELAALRLTVEVTNGNRFTSRDGMIITSELASHSERISVLQTRLTELERDYARHLDTQH